MHLARWQIAFLSLFVMGCQSTSPISLTVPSDSFATTIEELGDQLAEEQEEVVITPEAETQVRFYYPMTEYTSHRTRKTFGQYIPPDSGDRFSGYHTGDDIEVDDPTTLVESFAVTDATVIRLETIPGYGGVLILEFTVAEQTYHALYGHIDVATVPYRVGDTVLAGAAVAELGDDRSTETDGERKHLHFGMYPFSSTELFAGYVTTDTELTYWIDPVSFLRDHQAIDLADPLTAQDIEAALQI